MYIEVLYISMGHLVIKNKPRDGIKVNQSVQFMVNMVTSQGHALLRVCQVGGR